MPKLTIDGVETEVAQGTTILDAALSIGIEIPHYCYHPGLPVAGNCHVPGGSRKSAQTFTCVCNPGDGRHGCAYAITAC